MKYIMFKYPVLMIGFVLTIQGFSYHTDNRDNKFDGERHYNEIHNTIGMDYEINFDENIFSFGAVTFKNSHYSQSKVIQTAYKWSAPNSLFTDYVGLKAGIVTGYEEREINGHTINKGGFEYMPVIVPTYSIKHNGYEVEFSYLPKNPDPEIIGTHLFMMLVKFDL